MATGQQVRAPESSGRRLQASDLVTLCMHQQRLSLISRGTQCSGLISLLTVEFLACLQLTVRQTVAAVGGSSGDAAAIVQALQACGIEDTQVDFIFLDLRAGDVQVCRTPAAHSKV
jgi:hypothetical protein